MMSASLCACGSDPAPPEPDAETAFDFEAAAIGGYTFQFGDNCIEEDGSITLSPAGAMRLVVAGVSDETGTWSVTPDPADEQRAAVVGTTPQADIAFDISRGGEVLGLMTIDGSDADWCGP